MEFRILGPLEAISDGQALEFGGAKQRALLAVLLLRANEVVSQDRLIEAHWEDGAPEAAQKSLHVHVFGLRKAATRGCRTYRGGAAAVRTKGERALGRAR
jgi:DNA-binding SARP family transcriptional activator